MPIIVAEMQTINNKEVIDLICFRISLHYKYRNYND